MTDGRPRPSTESRAAGAHRSYRALVAREFLKRRLAVVALVVTALLVVVAVFAPYIANDAPIILRESGRYYFPTTFTYDQFRLFGNSIVMPLPQVIHHHNLLAGSKQFLRNDAAYIARAACYKYFCFLNFLRHLNSLYR